MSGVGVAFGLGVALALAYERVEGGDVAVSNFLPEPILFESQAIVDNHMAKTIKAPLASRIGIFFQPLILVLFWSRLHYTQGCSYVLSGTNLRLENTYDHA
jgi:hypothetical protein